MRPSLILLCLGLLASLAACASRTARAPKPTANTSRPTDPTHLPVWVHGTWKMEHDAELQSQLKMGRLALRELPLSTQEHAALTDEEREQYASWMLSFTLHRDPAAAARAKDEARAQLDEIESVRIEFGLDWMRVRSLSRNEEQACRGTAASDTEVLATCVRGAEPQVIRRLSEDRIEVRQAEGRPPLLLVRP